MCFWRSQKTGLNMESCDHDCLRCIYEDCIDQGEATYRELMESEALDREICKENGGKRPKRQKDAELNRAREREQREKRRRKECGRTRNIQDRGNEQIYRRWKEMQK